MTILPGCSVSSGEPRELDDWHSIALPGGMVPSAVNLLGNDGPLLIGGHIPASAERSPALARLPLGGSDAGPSPIRLTPATPYGEVADLVSFAGVENAVVALGAAHGGAHANFRWTIWTGTTAGVRDRPQTFETFGGWEAGTLLGVATDASGPLIVGTWQGKHGLDGAVWRADGERWVRQPAAPALANTAQRQVAPRSVSQPDDRSVVVNGSVIELGDGVRQSAATWRATDGDWSLTVLGDPGKRSEAWSTACATSCWTAGGRDGALAVWAGDQLVEVPSVPVGDADAAQVLLGRDRVVVVASSTGLGRLLVGDGKADGSAGAWRVYTAPDGIVRSAVLVDTRLYLVTGTDETRSLWMRDLTDVLIR